MNKTIADKWVKALRSGNYEQGYDQLRNGNKFCVLGVLCDIHAQEHPDIATQETDSKTYLEEDCELPDKVRDWAGMYSCAGKRADSEWFTFEGDTNSYSTLIDANDGGHVTFNCFANYISKHWAAL